ncbi:spherulation-specific family 4 protein [Deinococcus aerophilus]|uniref:Uncharacterized protein n=1 Tax=Deinococcus aerophilus TaxID=522488 RepID=A0ABQ2GZN3_9DEIO|nr:spherulation-specific family 4 protein [Deinococcus aerophilus]GGM21846.1 hypothetical protein GCM10010841_32140 [Deinococcus aerophilus]
MKNFGFRKDPDAPAVQADLPRPIFRRPPALLLPFYLYPTHSYTNPVVNRLIAAARAYPSVEFNVIWNNNSGPGREQDADYTVAIRRVRACSNVRIIGYINTTLGFPRVPRPAAVMRGEIEHWKQWYDVDAIFFDQMTVDDSATHAAYYADLTEFSHGLGIPLTIGNGGTATPQRYFDAHSADLFCVWENSVLPSEADLAGNYQGGYADYPTVDRAALIYGQPTFDHILAATLSRQTGMWGIRQAGLPNPYVALPDYFEELLAWMAGTGVPGGKPLLGAGRPHTPPASGLQLYAHDVAGHSLPAFVGPGGSGGALQAALAHKGVGVWLPGSDTMDTIGLPGVVVGILTTPAIGGTAPAFANSIRRWRTVSEEAAGSAAEVRAAQFAGLRGSAPGVGGFWYVHRFSEACALAGQRLFVGLSASTGAWDGATSPPALTQVIGVGHDARDGHLFLYSAGTVAAGEGQDLGAAFPANTPAAVYEFALFCVGGASAVHWQVTRLDTGDQVGGELGADRLPAAGTPLAPRAHLNNGAVAASVMLDQSRMYFETAY